VFLLVATPLPNGFIPLFVDVRPLLLVLLSVARSRARDGLAGVDHHRDALRQRLDLVRDPRSDQPELDRADLPTGAVWSADVVTFIAVEFALAAIALAISFVVNSERPSSFEARPCRIRNVSTLATRLRSPLVGAIKRYGKTVALDGVNLDVRRGSACGARPERRRQVDRDLAVARLLQPDEGEARLISRSPLDVESRRDVGVMMQEVALDRCCCACASSSTSRELLP
jgi:hypothetical protein